MQEGENYCHKQEAIYYDICAISGDPRNLSSTDGHIRKCKVIRNAKEIMKIGENVLVNGL